MMASGMLRASGVLDRPDLEAHALATLERFFQHAVPTPAGVELPPGTMVSISVLECDNAESMASAALELTLAGLNVNRIPVMEVPVGEIGKVVERLRG